MDRQLGVPPGQGFVVDTYLLHQVEVGRVQVRVGRDEQPAPLRVMVEQLEDVDGSAGGSTGPRVLLHEPPGWSEDYTPAEARRLAEVLQDAARVAAAEDQ